MPRVAIDDAARTPASALTCAATSVRAPVSIRTTTPVAPSLDLDPPTAAPPSVATARDALEQGAVNRLRVYRVTMLAWCMGGLVASVLVPGLLRDRVICWASAAAFVGSYVLRRDEGSPAERVRNMFPVAIVQALAATGVGVGLGLASPYVGLLSIGLALYGLSAPRRHAVTVFATVAGAYAVLCLLSIVGILPGTGLLAPAPIAVGTKIVDSLWVEATLFTGFVVGRYVRRDARRLSLELEAAVRDSAHREALLVEAQADLARVVKVGARGPFTGVELAGFRLGLVIGRGGMGEVYEAKSKMSGDTIEAAVKLLRRDLLAEGEIVRRFERESRIVASIWSPHVVRVLAVGGAGAPLPFIAMERLTGEDLVSLLRARGKLDLDEVAELVRHVGEGLRVAHGAGVVHRDLKPANLYLAETKGDKSRWVILDFGVSKLLIDGEGTLTTDQVLGTPHYMAPEQAAPSPDGRRVLDGRADLYSLGAIVYRALTGQLPFVRNDMADVVHALLNDMPTDPRLLDASIPADVVLWLAVALAKRPDDRFVTALELMNSFDDARRGELSDELRVRAQQLLAQRRWAERRR